MIRLSSPDVRTSLLGCLEDRRIRTRCAWRRRPSFKAQTLRSSAVSASTACTDASSPLHSERLASRRWVYDRSKECRERASLPSFAE
eukprot:1048317-Prymnesium_polylepis.1